MSDKKRFDFVAFTVTLFSMLAMMLVPIAAVFGIVKFILWAIFG